MQSSSSQPQMADPSRFPLAFFWPQPGRSGLLGRLDKGDLLVMTNYFPALRAWQKAIPGPVLSIDTGGFDPGTSVAFGYLSCSSLISSLSSLSHAQEQVQALVLPPDLAAALHIHAGDKLGLWPVKVATNLPGAPAASTPLSPLLLRLLAVLRLALGQWLVFLVPTFFFGWQVMVLSGAAVLVTALSLALFWKILPGPVIVKGALVGLILAAAALAIGQLAGSLLAFLPPALGLWLLATWLGIVLSGLKNR